MVTLSYRSGTIEVRGVDPQSQGLLPQGVWDPRAGCHRCPAADYAAIILALIEGELPYQDEARGYTVLQRGMRARREPRPYQAEALHAWRQSQGRGVVVLPTGAGKSYLGLMAIEAQRRSTLVVAPTLDLVRQWYDLLRVSFGEPVGVIGGGEYDVQDLTITTYDSAYLHMEHLGSRFGLVIFDECHHLPGEAYSWAAQCSLAPFRLGLTATPERTDGRETLLDRLIGPLAFRRDIIDLSGRYLADYETVRITLELSPEERCEYDEARSTYLEFIRRHGIRMGSPTGWSDFIIRASQSAEGIKALAAHRRQRQLAFAASAKFQCVEHLLWQHRDQQAILFTEDNATTHEISRRFLVPAITHQTKVTERSDLLAGLKRGTYHALVTSRVLNEGVDVPEASVAIIVSGSGSVREHVQRLGRILRKKEGKRAVLYELVTADTSETFTSDQRRDHSAYR